MLNTIALSASAEIPTGVASSALVAVLGYLVVFVGLVLLMLVITIMGKIMLRKKPQEVKREAPVPKAKVKKPESPPAPGSAGPVKLYDVPDKEAALIMAIVADKMGKPLNELRFKSIKEVK